MTVLGEAIIPGSTHSSNTVSSASLVKLPPSARPKPWMVNFGKVTMPSLGPYSLVTPAKEQHYESARHLADVSISVPTVTLAFPFNTLTLSSYCSCQCNPVSHVLPGGTVMILLPCTVAVLKSRGNVNLTISVGPRIKSISSRWP